MRIASTLFVRGVCSVLLGVLLVGTAGAQDHGEVTRVDGATLYVELHDSLTVAPETEGQVVEERVVDGDTVQLSFAVLAVERVERPIGEPWVAVAEITRQSRDIDVGARVSFESTQSRAQLVVETTPPGATVYVDGEEAGTTPFENTVGAGPHDLRLDREGYYASTDTVVLQSGQTRRVQDSLETAMGVLTVTSLPEGAQVEVGERTLGETPVSEELQAGRYTLRLRRDGYRSHEQTVAVPGGDERQVNVSLRRPLQVSAAEDQDTEVTNVAVEREADRLVVTYDLVGDEDAYSVSLLFSDDGGRSFSPLPETTAGAVGEGISPGSEKQIVWAATEDVPEGFTGSENRLRVAVEPERSSRLYWIVGGALAAGAGATAAAVLGVFGGGDGGDSLPDSPPSAP